MGTKNTPGNFDCYANADPDEPMFILLGRDRDAPQLVQDWADQREHAGEDAAKVEEARDCADAMITWLDGLGKKPRVRAQGDTGSGKLCASYEDDAWYLTAESPDGDAFIELAWPWPGEEKSTEELIAAGFEVL